MSGPVFSKAQPRAGSCWGTLRGVLINAQIAAPAFLGHNHRLSKKSHSLPFVGRAHNSNKRPLLREPHGQAAVWVAANSVGSLCTPTLIRPDNERDGACLTNWLGRCRCISERDGVIRRGHKYAHAL